MGPDELTSWRDGPAKQAIVDFVARVCGHDGSEPVPVEDRLAAFDNDGTLWCEKPMPIQLDFILRRLVEMAEADAALRDRQPWKAAYERDYGWLGAVMAEHYAGNDTNVRSWAAASWPRTTASASRTSKRRPTRSCTARSIRRSAAVISTARTRRWSTCSATWRRTGSRNYIASGGGRDFMRPISQEVYGIPRQRVIGSTAALAYTSDDRGGTITHKPEADYLDDGPQKPIRIWSRTGRRPLLAAGNSNGDIQMLHFTQHDDKPSPPPARPARRRRARVRLHRRSRAGARAGRARRLDDRQHRKDDWTTVF